MVRKTRFNRSKYTRTPQQKHVHTAKHAPYHNVQPTALTLGLAVAMLPAGLVAGDGTWKPNIELFLTPGTDRSHAGAGVLFPLRQDANSMTFLNGQLVAGENSTNEANIGLGHRWFSPDRKRIYGAYGFFDTRESENDRRYNQLSIGGEVLMDSWDLRANIYYPIDDEDKWDRRLH